MVAKRKLKDPNSPVVKRPAPEIALQAKIIELDDYRRAHALAVRAQIEDEQATSSMLKRDPGLAVEKRKLDFKIQRAIAETELLAVQARGERGKTPEAKTDWELAQRDRARLVIALRAANREISALRQQGVTGQLRRQRHPENGLRLAGFQERG